MTYKSNIKMHLYNGTQTEQKGTSRWEAAGNRLQMSSLLRGNQVSLLLCPGVKSIWLTSAVRNNLFYCLHSFLTHSATTVLLQPVAKTVNISTKMLQ